MRVKKENQVTILEIIERFASDLKKIVQAIISVIGDFLSVDEQDPTLQEVLNESDMSPEEINQVLASVKNISILEMPAIEDVKKKKKRKKAQIEQTKQQILNNQMQNSILQKESINKTNMGKEEKIR